MFQMDTEYRTQRLGLPRRDFIRVGCLSSLGITLNSLLRMHAHAAEGSGKTTGQPKAKSCILLWMNGGPSHLDTFDPKPDAPESVRGPFTSIETNVPGIRVGEHLPQIAQQADKFSIIRTLNHPSPAHGIARHIMLTGNVQARGTVNPSYGSVVFRERGQNDSLPPYVAVPSAPEFAGGGFLGGAYKPLAVGSDPNSKDFRVRGLTLPRRLTVDRLGHRRKMLAGLDTLAQQLDHEAQFGVLDAFYQRSYDMITSPVVKRAFDLADEDAAVRDRYGRNTLGQSCLLARRLVEAGVTFVHVDRGGWDTHLKNFERLKKDRLPELDQAFAALVEDLHERGLLESTLVVWMGEFGRTPKIDWSDRWQGGRHHWAKAFSVVVAGGGFRAGQVVGSSGPQGEEPKDRPVLPWDLGATLFGLLGVAYDKTYPDRGRNIRLLPYGTSVVSGGMLDEIT